MQLYDLTALHVAAPLGLDPATPPYFGWKMKSAVRGTKQTAYRLQVWAEDAPQTPCWDSGEVESEQAAFVEYAGAPLAARTVYHWRVTVWDNHGHAAGAESNFETALAQSDWQAHWMRTPRPAPKREKGFGKQPPATLFRRAFALNGQPVRARLYATCLGVYRLTVNGVLPDARELAPEHTSYRKMLCYQTYDLTTLLQAGENVLGIEVADGWYCCPQTRPPIDGMQPDHTILFQLEVTYADGSKQTICSDDAVTTHDSPLQSSDIFDGEKYDARLICPGWDAPGYDAAAWTPAAEVTMGYDTLHPQTDPPVRVVRELSAADVIITPKGETIVDFGQIVAGRTRVKATLPTGASLTLEHTETLGKDGNYFINTDSAMGVTEQKDEFISDGHAHEYEAQFAFHGFRYVRVTGPDTVRPENFTAVILSSEKPNAGTFECSDERLNRLYQNTRWSQCANMISIPTDCPQREKAGWTGDISLYARTALLNEDVTPFLTRWLQCLAYDQRENGSVPFTVPDVSIYHYSGIKMGESTGCGGPVCSAGWGDAAVTVPWAMYTITGNTAILRRQYASMKGWADYVMARARVHAPNSQLPDEIEEYLWNTGFQFGEWLIPSQANEPQEKIFATMAASAGYTAPIFGWLAVRIMSHTAEVLGYTDDAERYAAEADAMKYAIQTALITANGRMKVDRQGAYVLMLALGLVPDALKAAFADRLETLIRENGNRLDTGFLPTPYLLDALCMAGKRELAYTLLYQENAPAWLAQIRQGATTIWESWQMYDAEGNPRKESFNHYTYGAVDDWLFRNIGGIDQRGIGYRHLVFRPQPDAGLTWAKRSFMTEQGEAACAWQRADGRFTLDVTVPCNADAVVILPDGTEHTVGSGQYRFACDAQ